ncbi:uncharacterized protein LOC118739949 [Rhagoletis pomonella]|uniref:uncharacterized protein LOC118739949 n=1 Tax=Rhagoletis pomonella TaxID=28610 RepID=UPI00177F5474|nr:uncharacterized protein LOC118739949 [Rhagoletis pomonella]
MANNPAVIKPSPVRTDIGPSDKTLERQSSQSSEVDIIKRKFSEINLDASNKNFASSCLDETLSIYNLLASVGLEKYMDLFAARGFELEQFLDLSYLDLQLLGIEDSRHRNHIMELINAFRFD